MGKTSLNITLLKDKSLADLDNLPDPDELALDIVENLEAELESFNTIIASLNNKKIKIKPSYIHDGVQQHFKIRLTTVCFRLTGLKKCFGRVPLNNYLASE